MNMPFHWFDKLMLLLWKNWLLNWSHKRQLFVELLLPAILSYLLFKSQEGPFKHNKIIFSTKFPLNSLNLTRFYGYANTTAFHLFYSPKTNIFNNLIKEAATTLNISYTGCTNASELETAMLKKQYLAGIEFDSSLENITKLPIHLKYRIHFPTEHSNYLFLRNALSGPRNPTDEDGGIPVGYLRKGFLPIQNAISMAFLRQSKPELATAFPEILLQRFPYPEYMYAYLGNGLNHLLPYALFISYMYSATWLIKFIAVEKEKQLKEIMKMMGLENWLHWTAWFFQGFLTMGISVFIVVCTLTVNTNMKSTRYVPLFYNSSFGPLLLFFFIYTAATVTFCLMIGVFFSKANTAASVGGLLWVATIIPYTYINILPANLKLAWSLLCNTGMGLGLDIIFHLQMIGTGLQWNRIFFRIKPDEPITFGHVLLVMVLSCLINMSICLYVEQIHLGELGVPKKWYFPFTKSFWCGGYQQFNNGHSYNLSMRRNPELFEAEPEGRNIGLEIQELSKSFGKTKVVKALSMNLYEDEITVLLGHNSSGKTTTISMLTGTLPPTSGTAIFNGCNIRTNIDGARRSLGICPQYNILFDELTVSQHLMFYGRLKGLTGNALKSEVSSYIEKLNLVNKANVASEALSGGMKRKLSVCAAFCGGSKVVLCDEPSSGMDPASRRELWELLQSVKIGRTVLLTTHFMDEADVLGDRIAIMSEGELKCMGTPFFLKKAYGSDYLLICIKKNMCNTFKVTNLLNKFIPNLKPESDIGTELSYRLPDKYLPYFEEMFLVLEKNAKQLSINGYGVSISSLEDVFMKAGLQNSSKTIINENNNQHQVLNGLNESLRIENTVKGLRLTANQWRAMIAKKYLYSKRNKMLLFLQNFLPFLLITSIWCGPFYESKGLREEPMTFKLEQYFETVTVLETNATSALHLDISRNYKDIVNKLGSNHRLLDIKNEPFIDYMIKLGKTKQPEVDTQFIAAATVNEKNITVWFNNEALHSAPLALNLIHNALARTFIAPTASISVTLTPAAKIAQKEEESWFLRSFHNDITRYGMSILPVGFIMCIVSSYYTIFIIRERESRSKLLQFVSGVKVYTFWLTHFLWDSLTLMVTSGVILLTLYYHKAEGFSTFDAQARYIVFLFFFGCSVLPLTYIWSFFFTEPSTGLLRLSFINIILVFVMLILRLFPNGPIYEIFLILNPHFSLTQGFFKLGHNFHERGLCEELKSLSTCSELRSYFAWQYPGVLREVFGFIVSSILYFALLFMKEYHCFDVVIYRFNDIFRTRPELLKASQIDEDVESEVKRVEEMSPVEISGHNLVLDRFSKFYGGFLAVNQISVAVKRSECFGLLGVNGAGKTTIFKIITGDERIFSGEAYVKGLKLKTEMSLVDREIGYCPQFDALFPNMTAEETLRMFGLLRGIPLDRISHVSSELAASLGFIDHYDKYVRALSGGNKRKLSTAVAIIGGPSVLYLDEPTTGMDPAARRQVWSVICELRDSGKTIILTSHSMEECEALCSRIAIMVNGEFKCLGSTQHLRNRFGNELILKFKMRKTPENMPVELLDENIQNVLHFISSEFPHARLQERYQRFLTFYIPLLRTSWSRVFGILEKNRDDLNIEDYSVSQISLEEIFLQLAQNQRNDKRNHTRSLPGVSLRCFKKNRNDGNNDQTSKNLI